MPLHKVGRHVATTCFSGNRIVWGGTWLPRATYINYSYFCALEGGTYIYVPICVHTIKIHELLNKVVSFIVLEVSFDTGTVLNSCLMGLGCPLLLELSDRRLRRCAATLPRLLERTFLGLSSFSVLLEVMAAVRDLEEGNISFLVHRLSGMCCRQWSCMTSPSFCVR